MLLLVWNIPYMIVKFIQKLIRTKSIIKINYIYIFLFFFRFYIYRTQSDIYIFISAASNPTPYILFVDITYELWYIKTYVLRHHQLFLWDSSQMLNIQLTWILLHLMSNPLFFWTSIFVQFFKMLSFVCHYLFCYSWLLFLSHRLLQSVSSSYEDPFPHTSYYC